jgi:hypothetical protein
MEKPDTSATRERNSSDPRHDRQRRLLAATLVGAAVVFGLASVNAAADEPAPDLPAAWRAAANDSALRALQVQAPDAATEIRENNSYIIPAAELVGFNVLLNLANRHTTGNEYVTNASTIRRNLRRSWIVDSDPFKTNQLAHPYQGSMYLGFARSAGIDYWESLGYTFAGSAMWEIAGESVPPSRNDLLNTGLGGSFLGEALFRMASLVLENQNLPPFWREAGAALISPATAFNRLAFGNRFDTIFPSHDPVFYSRLQLGFSGTAQNETGTSTTKLQRNEALADFAIDYGLPGKPGYTYARPFDYFTFQATVSSANGFENLMTKGLLAGRDYELGPDYRGIWGLYGIYDYIAPQTFRVSSTALALGTTGQWWLSKSIALQGTALLGAGYAAVGTTHSTLDSDYHYGVAPQALLSLRAIFGERASFDVTGREYFVSRVAAATRGGHDNIARIDASFTLRVYKQHAVAIKYLGNRRDAFYPDVNERFSQTRGTIGIFYAYLGHDQFGAVEWR